MSPTGGSRSSLEPETAARAEPAPACGASPAAPARPDRRVRTPRGRRSHRGDRRRRGGVRLRVVVRPRLAAVDPHRPELLPICRRRLAARVDPRRAQPPTGSGERDVVVDPESDDRDRGPPLLRARWGRHRGNRPRGRHRPQGRADRRGGLHDHAAARTQPLHLARAHGQEEAQGGLPRNEARASRVEAVDPDDVPQPDLLRQPGLRHRGRVADVLLEALERADPERCRAPRRAHAGAVDLQPVHRAAARACTARRGATRDARHRSHHAAAVSHGW